MDLKQWRCKNDHALGMIRINGDGSPQLMLYRHAVDLSAEHPAEVDLMIGPLVGRMPVRCDICDDVRVWDVSVEALADLIRGLKRKQLMQLQLRLSQGRMKPRRAG
ncbi:MAG: hypothetical protein EHM40_11095 [Chloroflexi bacterium]|nr:MAG: hypothetical protein EHM40_11095 [Chloroflexota bacterium]